MERKQKRARGAQRKELVNRISSKAGKPKGKGCSNWAKDAQRMKQAEDAQRIKWMRVPKMLNELTQHECWVIKTKIRNNMRNWHGRRFSLQAQK